MNTKFNPFTDLSIEELALELGISFEMCRQFKYSGKCWQDWIRDYYYEQNIRRQKEYYNRMQEYYDKYGSH